MMEILHFCTRFPFPTDDGYLIVCRNLARGLRDRGAQVDLLCFTSDRKQVEKYREEAEKIYRRVFFIERNQERQYLPTLIAALLKRESYFVRKYRRPDMARLLTKILTETHYDRTILEGIYLGLYDPELKRFSQQTGQVTVRLHNIESEIFRRLAKREKNPAHKWLLKRESVLFQEFEINTVTKIDDVRAITHRDAQVMEELAHRKLKVLGPSIDLESNKPGSKDELEPLSLVCVGNMNWLPNVRGMDWFLDEIWPSVRREFPDAKFYAIGKNPPETLRQRAEKGIVVTGYVDDVRPYFRRAHVFIVPLLEGSGVRIKILMALATGKEIVSTSVGAEGIAFDGLHIANTPDEWIRKLRELLLQPPRNRTDAVDYARAHHDFRRPLD